MAGIGCYSPSSALSFRRGILAAKLQFSNIFASSPDSSGEPLRRSSLAVRVEVDYVNAEEAKKLIAVEGYAVVDVRDKTQFQRAHIKDCYHIPLFNENNDNDLGTIIKRTVHNNFSGLFFGLPFTMPNPDFVQSVKSQFSPESKLLLVCQQGLRSAGAAQKLEAAGYKNITCITSGLQSVETRNIRICWFFRAAKCRQGWFGYSAREDLNCSWNRTRLCFSFHNFLPRSSRNTPSDGSFKPVLVL